MKAAQQNGRGCGPEQKCLPTLSIARVVKRNQVAHSNIEQIKSRPVLRINVIVQDVALGMMDQRPKDVAFVIVVGPSGEEYGKGC